MSRTADLNRRIVDRNLPTRILRPVASPVSTYAAPQQNGADVQLADALSALAPSLARLGGVMAEQKNAQDRADGQHRARQMTEEGQRVAQMQREGTLPPERNAWFRAGFYETVGRAEGNRYVGDFLAALEASPVKDSPEMDAYDQFERDFRRNWVAESLGDTPDSFTANSFGLTVDGQMAGLRNEFARRSGENLVKMNGETFQSEIFETVRSSLRPGASPEVTVAAILLAQQRQAATGGMNFSEINKRTAAAIAAAAEREHNLGMLGLLDRIKTDPNSNATLAGTSYGSALREAAEGSILRYQEDERQAQAVAEKARKASEVTRIQQAMFASLQEAKGAVDLQPFFAEMMVVDPTEATRLTSMADAFNAGTVRDNPMMLQQLNIGLYAEPGSGSYTTGRDLDTAYANLQLTNSTYQSLRTKLTERDAGGGSFGSRMNRSDVEAVRSAVRAIFRPIDPQYDTQANKLNAELAASEAVMEYITFLERNPAATDQDLERLRSTITTRIVRARAPNAEAVVRANNSVTQLNAIPNAQYTLSDAPMSLRFQAQVAEMLASTRTRMAPEFNLHLRSNGIDPNADRAVLLPALQKLARKQKDVDAAGAGRPTP